MYRVGLLGLYGLGGEGGGAVPENVAFREVLTRGIVVKVYGV